MNTQMQKKAQTALSTSMNIAVDETDQLSEWGFNQQEIVSLLWLRQWYQNGGSDRANIMRHLEFLRMLVQSGELEL